MSESEHTPGIKVTDGKGFHITFANGWTASVQFGSGNYSDNYRLAFGSPAPATVPKSRTAEVAAWDSAGDWLKTDEHGEVRGYLTTDEVLAFLNEVAAKPATGGEA